MNEVNNLCTQNKCVKEEDDCGFLGIEAHCRSDSVDCFPIVVVASENLRSCCHETKSIWIACA